MNLTIPYVKIQCDCGFIFAVPRSWDERRRKDHSLFWCPACGFNRYYPEENEKEWAMLELGKQAIERRANYFQNRFEQTEEDLDYFKRRAAAYKGCFIKLKKKIKGES